MKVLSWNVNGLSRAKMESEDFVSNIAVNDIVFLYESWTSSNIVMLGDAVGALCYTLKTL